jgi:REP element-mobilizing transposase RayT
MNYYPKFEPHLTYHIYNRGNNKENIFYQEKNYDYFYSKMIAYLCPYITIHSYCLLPNHFHLLAQVKPPQIFYPGTEVVWKKNKPLYKPDEIISEQFRKFFISYSKSINVQQGRTGSLFQKNFKRLVITDEHHYKTVMNYIHQNPQTHKICKDFRSYPYSSYQGIILRNSTIICAQRIMDQFGGEKAFFEYHKADIPYLSDMECLDNGTDLAT